MAPFIARDTRQPLVVLGGYGIGQGGGIITRPIDTTKAGDYGADPIGNGMFRMIPSGDIVDFAERTRRLTK